MKAPAPIVMQKFFKFLLWTGVILGGIVLLGRAFLFEVWTVPDGSWVAASSAPTLAGGDTVLVLTRGEPSFGDLVRCKDPEKDGYVVGRIVGTSGDQVELKGRSLRVNGVRYDTSEACAEPRFTIRHPDTGDEMEFQCGRLDIGGGWHFAGISSRYDAGNDHSHRVGQGRFYLLSDNRDVHDDSRDFGTVPVESCQGPIFARLWGIGGWSQAARRLDVIR